MLREASGAAHCDQHGRKGKDFPVGTLVSVLVNSVVPGCLTRFYLSGEDGSFFRCISASCYQMVGELIILERIESEDFYWRLIED